MKKTKRYDGEDGSMVEAGSGSMNDDNSGAPPAASPSPRATKQRIVSKEELEKSGMTLRDFLNKERGLTRRGESSTPAPTKSAPVPTARPTTPPVGDATDAAPKKQMYRTFGGKMAEKSPDTDAMSGVRETIGRGLKSAAEGVGDYVRGLGKREEKHGTYVKDGKVVRYAKGGSVSKASSRADGIAQRGKTKGRMI